MTRPLSGSARPRLEGRALMMMMMMMMMTMYHDTRRMMMMIRHSADKRIPGHQVGHTAVMGMFSKVLGKGPQGYLMGWFGSAGSLARVVFPIVGGHIAEELGDNTLFLFVAMLLTISCVILVSTGDVVRQMIHGDH
jgi:hypothetical protein